MKQKISILGCGWLGLPLAKELCSAGFEINGSTTSISKIENIRNSGIKPFLVNLNELSREIDTFLNTDVLIVNIPSKNIKGFQDLIVCIEKSTIQKVLFVSSTSVYPFTNNVVTEETQLKDSPLVQIEQLFKSNGNFESTILRFGGLFGEDRHPGNFIKKDRLIENPEGFVNLIHRNDCIKIVKQIISKNIWNETFNACSDVHPKRREFYNRQTQLLSKPSPVFNESKKSQYKIISSDKLKSKLDYTFEYADLMNI